MVAAGRHTPFATLLYATPVVGKLRDVERALVFADFALTASFAGAPVGVSPFTINTGTDEVMGLVGAGLDVINGDDAVLRFNYDGQLGETTQIHTVGIKGSARF